MIAIEMFPLWIYPWNGNNKWKYIFQICRPGLKQNLFLSRDFQFDTEHILVMNHWIVHRELFWSTRVVRACCTMQIKQEQYQQTNKQTNQQVQLREPFQWQNFLFFFVWGNHIPACEQSMKFYRKSTWNWMAQVKSTHIFKALWLSFWFNL